MARRVADDPAFLAYVLAVYAASEGMDDVALARHLDLPIADLTRLRLCLRPRSDAERFWTDVEEIATAIGTEAAALAAVVRRADALTAMRGTTATQGGTLMAARDLEEHDSTADGPASERP